MEFLWQSRLSLSWIIFCILQLDHSQTNLDCWICCIPYPKIRPAYEVIYLSIMNYKITVTLIMWNIESAYDNPSHLDFFVGLLESNECLPIYWRFQKSCADYHVYSTEFIEDLPILVQTISISNLIGITFLVRFQWF